MSVLCCAVLLWSVPALTAAILADYYFDYDTLWEMQLHVSSQDGPLHAGSCGLKLQREQLLHALWHETDW